MIRENEGKAEAEEKSHKGKRLEDQGHFHCSEGIETLYMKTLKVNTTVIMLTKHQQIKINYLRENKYTQCKYFIEMITK